MISKKNKQILLYITFGILLYALVTHLSAFLQAIRSFTDLLVPLFAGLLIAFVLNVPMTGLEKQIHKLEVKFHLTVPLQFLHFISLVLTILFIVLIFLAAATMAVPAIVQSIQSIPALIESKWPEFMAILSQAGIDTKSAIEAVDDFYTQYVEEVGDLFSMTYHALSSTLSTALSLVFGFIIAIYLLLAKDRVSLQTKRIVYAYLPEKAADQLTKIAYLIQSTYSRFLSGQCVEAVILGLLMCLTFTLFRLPYAILTGFLTGIMAFVPYVGAAASCGIALLLCFLVNPHQLLLCLIVYTITQFIENQLIYPHVVGSSVGLSPLLTLLAALIGGKIFGLLGIIFFIPLTACLVQLLNENVTSRLKAGKKISPFPKFISQPVPDLPVDNKKRP